MDLMSLTVEPYKPTKKIKVDLESIRDLIIAYANPKHGAELKQILDELEEQLALKQMRLFDDNTML